MDKFGRKVQWDVKRSVYTASAFYFFYYGGKSCLFPFMSLFFKQMGLSASQTGLVFGLKSLLWYCASPVWMAVALRVRKTKTILCYSIFIVIGSNLALTLLPPGDPELPYKLCVHETPSPISDANITSDNYTTTFSPLEGITTASVTHLQAGNSIATNYQNGGSSPVTSKPFTVVSTNSEAHATPSELTVYQMAKKLLPEMKSNGFTTQSGEDIADYISRYDETVGWPDWKQHQLQKKIISFLGKASNEENKSASRDGETDKNQIVISRLAEVLAKNFSKDGPPPTEQWLNGVLAKFKDITLSRAMKATLLQTILEKVNQRQGEKTDAKKSRIGGPPRKRWALRVKRDVDEMQGKNHTSSLLDAIQSINLTSLSETGKAKIHNLTNSLEKFARELGPYLTTNTTLFFCILIIVASGELLSAPIELVSDESLYKLLDELDSLNQYGKHRMTALVGACLASVSVCIMVYYAPCYLNGNINRFHIHFYFFALLLGISFMLAPFYPSYEPRNDTAKSRISGAAKKRCPTCSSMICSSCRHFLLLVTVFVVGITQAPVQNFLLWTIQDMEGASELVYGCYVSVNALCAMLTSLCARPLIKLMKPCTVGFISLMSIALQLLLYAFIPTPWLIVPLQLLNITGQSFLWAIVGHHTSTTMSSAYENSRKISDVHVFARASQQRSLHTAYVSVYQGLSFSIGSIVSGFLLDFCMGDLTPIFIGSAVIVATWGILFALYQCCCLPRKIRRKYSHLVSDSETDAETVENSEFQLKETEKNGNYVSNYYNVRKPKTKRSGKSSKKVAKPRAETDSSSDDDKSHETDWLNAAMRKDSRML